MKLYISQNIKKLRQSRSLTQEELAERLGVSYQSVSRWETGLSYPDIELIPEIAAFFEVSTDVLMGVEKATAEQNLASDLKKVRMDVFDTKEERLAFLKEMHRKYPHDAETLIHLIYALSCFPEYSEEMQKKIRQYLCHPHAEKVYMDMAVRLLIASEEESAIPELLNHYAAEEDMSRAALLKYRARNKNDWTAYKKYKQMDHLHKIYGVLNDIYPYSCPPCFIYNDNKIEDSAKRALALINLMTDTTEGSVIIGDGEPDLWYGHRLVYGYQLAGSAAVAGRKEEALDTLEAVVSLAEKFYSMPEGSVLTYRTPELSELQETFRYGVRNPDDVQDFSENLHRCMRSDEMFCGVDLMYNRPNGDAEFDHHVECAAWDIIPLLDIEEWSCFNSIRDDERFKNCIRRMEKYVIPATKN